MVSGLPGLGPACGHPRPPPLPPARPPSPQPPDTLSSQPGAEGKVSLRLSPHCIDLDDVGLVLLPILALCCAWPALLALPRRTLRPLNVEFITPTSQISMLGTKAWCFFRNLGRLLTDIISHSQT